MTNLAVDTTKAQRSWKDIDLRAVAPFVALALLLVLGSFANPNFLSIDNLLNVITRSAFIAIIAIGATFVISAGGLDLSVGAMVAFVASLMIMFINSGAIADPAMMLVAAMVLAVAIGATCGLANGLITTVGRIEPFIARNFLVSIVRFVGHHILTVRTPMGRKARPKFLASAAPLVRGAVDARSTRVGHVTTTGQGANATSPRLVEPSRRWSETSSTLITTPSIS